MSFLRLCEEEKAWVRGGQRERESEVTYNSLVNQRRAGQGEKVWEVTSALKASTRETSFHWSPMMTLMSSRGELG